MNASNPPPAGSSVSPEGPSRPPRALRSFARRGGRMTVSQRRGLDEHWQALGLDADGEVDLQSTFGREAPCIVEIGFGMGDSLVAMAAADPSSNYIGIEVYEPGIGRVLNRAAEAELTNLRIMRADAAEALPRCFAPASLAAVLLYFPDPWPKKRHHRRRLLQPGFADMVRSRLARGGRFELATDVEHYAQQMREVLGAMPGFRNLGVVDDGDGEKSGSDQAASGGYGARSARRQRTKFERRGERLGHTIRDLVFERVA